VLLRGVDGYWSLSPAFDVLPTAQGLGYQQLHVGAQGHESSIANALSEARAFGLTADPARQSVVAIAAEVAQWADVFRAHEVCPADIDPLAQTLEAARLKEQRHHGTWC
jgi:serine/threonine-protein kinase HipA